MSIDDIDILTDKKTALTTNEILKKYLIEKVAFKTSPQFKSYFGQFKVNNILVEIMGDWQIKGAKGGWSQPFTAAPREIKTITFNRQKVVVTTPEAELSFFALMGRWNAYHKIKEIVGDLQKLRNPKKAKQLAQSENLWERRIAIMSTFAFVKDYQFADTLKIAQTLLGDKHDFIHKAVGWMLREIGKRNQKKEEEFLEKYAAIMPPYAIEKFSKAKRNYYMRYD